MDAGDCPPPQDAASGSVGPKSTKEREAVAPSGAAFLLDTFLWPSKEKYLALRRESRT